MQRKGTQNQFFPLIRQFKMGIRQFGWIFNPDSYNFTYRLLNNH